MTQTTLLELERLDDDGAPPLSGAIRWSHHDPTADGAWWPSSGDAVGALEELVPLVLKHFGVTVTRVSLNIDDWSAPHQRRWESGGKTVRLGWFHALPAGTATLGHGSDTRLVLHVHPCSEVPS